MYRVENLSVGRLVGSESDRKMIRYNRLDFSLLSVTISAFLSMFAHKNKLIQKYNYR